MGRFGDTKGDIEFVRGGEEVRSQLLQQCGLSII